MKKCLICGVEFKCKSHRAKYCSYACRCVRDRAVIRDKYRDKLEAQHAHDALVPECRICGLKSTNLSQHILRIHSMHVEEYKEQFGCTSDDIVHPDKIKSQREFMKGDKNPGRNHGGKYSPISQKFIKYQELSEEERDNIIRSIKLKQHNSREKNISFTTRKEYWMVHYNMSEEQALNSLKQRQTTFSKNICIQKYGEQQGLNIWHSRQQKWLTTLNSKTIEEIQDINLRKNCRKGFSKIAATLFKQIDVYGTAVYKKHQNDKEYIVETKRRKWAVDFIYNNRIIEFYGDVWHANPYSYPPQSQPLKWKGVFTTALEMREKDSERIKDIESSGAKVLIVWERDFRKAPQECIDVCMEFLYD